MTTETTLILIDRWVHDSPSVDRADSLDARLRNTNQRRRRERQYLGRCVCVVTINAGRMAVVVQKVIFRGVMRIGLRRKWMPDLAGGVLGKDAWRHGRDIRACVVAGNAILLIGSTQKPRRPLRIVRSMTRNACVLGYRSVASQPRLWRDLVGHDSMGTGGPVGNWIYFAGHLAGRVVAGQAHRAIGTVAN